MAIQGRAALSPLSIWLVTTGEPLEIDEGSGPLLRTGRLATFLAARGHSVTWWTSRFDHRTKTKRTAVLGSSSSGVETRLIDSPGYATNISIQRLRDHRAFATNFHRQALAERRPDIVLASLPTVDAAEASVRAGMHHRCPTVIDVRDEWPDVLLDHLALAIRPFAGVALSPMNRRARFALAHATAIIGITDAYVSWGLEKAGRSRRSLDEPFPIAREGLNLVSPGERAHSIQALKAAGLSLDASSMTVCIVGTLGRQLDIPTVINAARELLERKVPAHFVIAGDGSNRVSYTNAAIGLSNVTFAGHLPRAGVEALLRLSSVGIAPYVDIRNFRDNVPNKIVEYLSAGLPIITPLPGEVARLIDQDRVGLRYSPGSSHELSEAVARLARDVSLRQALSDNAQRVFLTRHEHTHVHTRIADYLEHVAGDNERWAR